MDDKKGKGWEAFHGTVVCICTAVFGGMEAMLACVEVGVSACCMLERFATLQDGAWLLQ